MPDSPPGSPPRVIRHPEFYFPDGTAIFSLRPQKCYNVHPSVMAFRSTFFASKFSLPRGATASADVLSEGRSDANPIKLPATIGQTDFDHMLTYLYKGPPDHPKTNAFLISVLFLSTFYGIEDGITSAATEFERRPETVFHPALKFQLARCYRVDQWIDPAFRKLVEIPIQEISMEHMEQIGPYGFFHLVQTKEKLLTVRREMAFHIPPAVNYVHCETPGFCGYAWAQEWRGNVPRIIHHPDEPASCVDLLSALQSTTIDKLSTSCRDLSVTWLWGKGWSKREEETVDEAIAQLILLQTGAPVQATLSDTVSTVSAEE
ncbi:hypothetical protein C8R46DRAFT_882396 [Mycena filopes]|nr:hypothetical protein C8R46DRAFT_882396 [Mycena filopes]